MSSIIDQKVSPTAISKKHDKSIFIWLDILGFADSVDDEKRYGELSELLTEFQLLFNSEHSFSSHIISDGLILQIANPRYETFKEIISDIGKKQFQFILKTNEFIRGGIAIGTRLEDSKGRSNQFISNGLARAVKMEANHVVWPIIGTDERNISDIRKLFNIDDKEEYFGLVRGFNKNGDDIFFIDFISQSIEYLNILNSKIDCYSEKEKEKDKDNPKVRDKYIWLLRYYLHNFKSNDITASLQGAVL